MLDDKFDQLDTLQEQSAAVEREKASLMAEILVAAIREGDKKSVLQLLGSVAGTQFPAERLLTAVRNELDKEVE